MGKMKIYTSWSIKSNQKQFLRAMPAGKSPSFTQPVWRDALQGVPGI